MLKWSCFYFLFSGAGCGGVGAHDGCFQPRVQPADRPSAADVDRGAAVSRQDREGSGGSSVEPVARTAAGAVQVSLFVQQLVVKYLLLIYIDIVAMEGVDIPRW